MGDSSVPAKAGLLAALLLCLAAADVAAQEGTAGGAAPAPVPAAEPAPGGFRQSAEAPAAALPPAAMKEAKRHFDEGVSAFQQGRLGSARAEFEEAYRLSKEPDLLFNLAQVATELDKIEDAVAYYAAFLKARPATPDRADVEKTLGRLRARLASEQKAQAEREVTREATRRPQPPPQPAPAPRRLPRAALALLGAGGGVLLSGIALSAAAAGLGRTLNSGEHFNEALVPHGVALQQAGTALAVIGGAAAVAGGTWLLLHHRRAGAPERPRAALLPMGAGLALVGAF